MSATSISNAWLRCGDGFESTSVLESQRPSNKKSRIKKHLGPLLTSAESASRSVAAESSKEAEDIIWTSSGSDFSDDGNKLIPRLHSKKTDASKTKESPSRHDLLLEDRISEDELELIDWEKDTDSTDQCDRSEKEDSSVEISDSDSCTNTNSLPVKEESDELCKAISTEISEYSSDNDSVGEGEATLATTAPGSSKGLQQRSGGDTGDVTTRPASEWLRSAQALLRTPGKQAGKAPRAPAESAKKRKLLR